MDDTFLSQTINFLEKSELQFCFPDIREIQMEQGSTVTTMRLGNSVYTTAQTVSENFIISNLVLFTLFEKYLEEKNNALIGFTFRDKYEQLIQHTDLDIMEKETFRLLQLIKNAIMCNAKGISITENYYEFSYENQKNKMPCHLYLQKNILSVLYTMILLMAKKESTYQNAAYKTGLLRSYYDELRNQITLFGNLLDEISPIHPNLIAISSGIRLNHSVRYQVKNPKFSLNQHIFTFERFTTSMSNYSCDYELILDGETYFIPQEALTLKNQIFMDEIHLWRIVPSKK